MGVIAQKVEKVFSEVINKDKEGMKFMAYEKLVGALIEAVKELKTENDIVKKENELLRDIFLTLNTRLDAFESMLIV